MPTPLRLLLCALLLASPSLNSNGAEPAPAICRPCIRGDMQFLASDELHGRGSATRDEHLAALYAASLFEDFGLQPGGDQGSFLQKAKLPNPLPARVQEELKNFAPEARTETWNAVAILRGSDPLASKDVILLTAHLDHLGIGPAHNGDSVYNGADDDASGTTAVIELARRWARGRRPRRTVVFALFGSEEIGGFGNRYFIDHPPMPLERIVANIEFEMIGRADPAIARQNLWMTGFERSNLGPALVAHGAHLVADPHPKERFFQRSDNFSLARRGIIAHTVSSFGLHSDYHQPSDEISRIDFAHMCEAIASMVGPIEWLANTTWRPKWNPGGRPEAEGGGKTTAPLK